MTISEKEADRLRRVADSTIEHAVAFKTLYHEKQDECAALEEIVFKLNRIIKKQGQTIASLEIRLGIDQEL